MVLIETVQVSCLLGVGRALPAGLLVIDPRLDEAFRAYLVRDYRFSIQFSGRGRLPHIRAALDAAGP